MKIIYHKSFLKSFDKLSLKLQKRVESTLALFKIKPFDEVLKNHPLKGPLLGKRAISVTGDVRIIFEEYENYVIVVLLGSVSNSGSKVINNQGF